MAAEGAEMTEFKEPTTEDEAAALISNLGARWGLPHKVWQRGDVTAIAEEEHPDLPGAEIDKLVTRTWESGRLKQLKDCTDSDWEIIRQAVNDQVRDDEHRG
jgi:hypothetical protein